MVELAQKSSRERLAETLLLLETKYGVEADGKTVAVRLTRTELAGLVGTVTESVIRLLSELAKEGVIDLVRSGIIIVDRGRLLEIANVGD